MVGEVMGATMKDVVLSAIPDPHPNMWTWLWTFPARSDRRTTQCCGS